MKVGGWLERLLFGKEGAARAEAASKRLEAALVERERPDDSLEVVRARLHAQVAECERRSRKLASDPPPLVRYVMPGTPSDLELTPGLEEPK